jgi:hypothetical protein
MALKALDVFLAENVDHLAHRGIAEYVVLIARGYARGFLPPVLQGVQAEIGKIGRVFGAVNAENPALILWSDAVLGARMIGNFHGWIICRVMDSKP